MSRGKFRTSSSRQFETRRQDRNLFFNKQEIKWRTGLLLPVRYSLVHVIIGCSLVLEGLHNVIVTYTIILERYLDVGYSVLTIFLA